MSRSPSLTKTLIAALALACGALLAGCKGDRSATVEPDGRVSMPIALPR
jgi:hypothetical protein